MSPNRMIRKNGFAFIAAIVFVMIFSAVSIGLLGLSSSNAQTARNHQLGNSAFSSALSGLEVMRHWMGGVVVPGFISENNRFAATISDLQDILTDADISWSYEPGVCMQIASADAPIVLDTAAGRTFFAEVRPRGLNGRDGSTIRITGQAGQLTRTLEVAFTYGTRPQTVFDFGVATKGPLELDGGTLTSSDASIRSYADVYIESLNDNKALGVLKNKSEIAGVAKIANPNADITALDIKGKVNGLTGQDAIDNAIAIGVTPTEFPYPNSARFKQYATGGYYAGGKTLENVIIKAGTNPKFTGNTTINGVLYIESPNVIDFGGNVTVNGMIVAEGDWNDNSATNRLAFTGSVDSRTLPADAKFNAMRGEKGTFLMAPGFDVSFWGSFGTLNGAIAGNGIKFGGNAGGTVKGSVINYSDTKMTVVGSSDIAFNRSGIEEIPSGFVQEIVIHYNPDSYSEVCSL